MAVDLTTGSYDEEGIFSKHDDIPKSIDKSDDDNECSLKNFRMIRIIKENATNKYVVVEGHFIGDDKPAIVIIEKMPFDVRDVSKLLSSESRLELKFRNNIYSNYHVYPRNGFNGIDVKLIYPACAKDFEKFADKPLVMVHETVEFFMSTVQPYLEVLSSQENYCEALNDPKDQEKIILRGEDPEFEFVLLLANPENCLCSSKHIKAVSFFTNKKLLCLRSLTQNEVPLLQKLQEKCLDELSKKYSISISKLESYVLYPPTNFPFHVIFESVDKDSPIPAEKAHHLNTIISNLQLIPDYYQKVALNYSLFEKDPLYTKYLNAKSKRD